MIFVTLIKFKKKDIDVVEYDKYLMNPNLFSH